MHTRGDHLLTQHCKKEAYNSQASLKHTAILDTITVSVLRTHLVLWQKSQFGLTERTTQVLGACPSLRKLYPALCHFKNPTMGAQVTCNSYYGVSSQKKPLGDLDIPTQSQRKGSEGDQVQHHNREILLHFFFFQKILVTIVVNSPNEKCFILLKLWKHWVPVASNCLTEQNDRDLNMKICLQYMKSQRMIPLKAC